MKYIYLLEKAHVYNTYNKLYNKCALRARDPHKQPKSLHEESSCILKATRLNTHTHTCVYTHTQTNKQDITHRHHSLT